MTSLASREQMDLLECPVCMDLMYPPIYQCSNGHIICSNCKPNVQNRCPTCRDKMDDIRSLALEKMVARFLLPCRYRESGCTGLYPYRGKLLHEQECKYKPFTCPYPCNPCAFSGDSQTLVRHLRHDHNSDFYENSLIDEVFHHTNPFDGQDISLNVTIYSCLGEHFCLHFEAFHSPLDLVYMAFLTFVGQDVDAANFRYKLEVGNKNGKMVWHGTPRSISEGTDQIHESCNGLLIHRRIAQSFAEINSSEELALRIKGLILPM